MKLKSLPTRSLDEYTEAEASRILDSVFDDTALEQTLERYLTDGTQNFKDLGVDIQRILEANAERILRIDQAEASGDAYASGDEHEEGNFSA